MPMMQFAPHGPAPRAQRGITIVEVLVGLAIGFFVLLAGAGILATFTGADRRMLLETRLVQDLRAATDVVTRDLRRAGYWANASSGVWVPGGPAVPPQNPYSRFYESSCDAATLPAQVATPTTPSNAVCYFIAQDNDNTANTTDRFGFKLDGGIIYAMFSGGAAVPLTDANTIAVSDFVITPSSQTISGVSFCTKTCTTNCPRLILREFEVLIKGNIPGDTTINRSMRSNVRVRNDYFDGQCPT